MKPIKIYLLITAGLFFMNELSAQICTNPTDTVYGLSTTGVIYPININNGGIGTHLDSLTDGNAPSNSNGMGYSRLNGKFYYFERINAGAVPVQDFVSYDPATKTVTSLALPSSPAIPAANKIRSGCCNNAGTGYYTIDPSGTGSIPVLYYYNIAGNTWTKITSVFKTPGGVDTSAVFKNLNSGDMAFDGSGNLWMLLSNTSQYALYKIAASVPTTTQAFVTVQRIIAPTAVPTSGKGIVGLAFNSAGTLFLSTGTGDNKLYKLTTTTSSLVFVTNIGKDDVGADLTSCSFPPWVLADTRIDFTACLNNGVNLTWKAVEDNSVTGYVVEYSIDGTHWRDISFVNKLFSSTSAPSEYTYIDHQYAAEKNYYRIVQTAASGKQIISETKLVIAKITGRLHVGPNPVKDIMYIYNKNNTSNYFAQVFDRSGRLVYYTFIEPSQQSINVGKLHDGPYLLKLTSSTNEVNSYQFIKW